MFLFYSFFFFFSGTCNVSIGKRTCLGGGGVEDCFLNSQTEKEVVILPQTVKKLLINFEGDPKLECELVY